MATMWATTSGGRSNPTPASVDRPGAAGRIPAVARGCDALLVLGDLINVLDYRTWDGILVEVYGRESVQEAAELRAQGRFDQARRVIGRRTGDPVAARAR